MNSSIKLLLAFGSVAALATSAFGDSLKLSTNTYSNGSNGGAYTASHFGTSLTTESYSALVATATSFETFCLEPTEYFNAGSTYDFTIASFAFGGANEHVSRNIGPGDQLSLGTTWLYSQYAQGLLAGFDYTAAGRKASNLTLQRAFWYLEDDYSYGDPLTNTFLSLVSGQFGSVAAAQANAADGAYGVWALNLTSTTGGAVTQHQSQLYYHVTSVSDETATLALFGAAFTGLMLLRRRFPIAR